MAPTGDIRRYFLLAHRSSGFVRGTAPRTRFIRGTAPLKIHKGHCPPPSPARGWTSDGGVSGAVVSGDMVRGDPIVPPVPTPVRRWLSVRDTPSTVHFWR